MNSLVPSSLLKSTNFITNWLFGAVTTSEKQLLKNIIKDTDPKFLKWAINQIVKWRNIDVPKNCIHIHGSNDRILTVKNVKSDYIIKNGGHFMTVNKAKEIERIIKKLC